MKELAALLSQQTDKVCTDVYTFHGKEAQFNICIKGKCPYWAKEDDTFFAEEGCIKVLEKKANILQTEMQMNLMAAQERAMAALHGGQGDGEPEEEKPEEKDDAPVEPKTEPKEIVENENGT